MSASPNERARILVVAATSRELAQPDGWLTIRCGVGPVEAAAATAAAIAELRPAAILHVGIAGARRESAVALATVVIGTESRYCDIDEARATLSLVDSQARACRISDHQQRLREPHRF